jgi:hypothetical protein
MYLPPYLPNYNPIELAFSKIKAQVHHDGSLGHDTLDTAMDDTCVYQHLLEVAFCITADDALGWFHHCGYI